MFLWEAVPEPLLVSMTSSSLPAAALPALLVSVASINKDMATMVTTGTGIIMQSTTTIVLQLRATDDDVAT